MAQRAATSESKSLAVWGDRARTAGVWLAIAVVAFVIGTYIFAPSQQRSQPSYLPTSYVNLPTGIITLSDGEGTQIVLPVRIADTSATRLVGFRDVGASAMDNQFLLYGQTRQLTTRTSYSVEKVRAPVEMAAIDGEGNVVSVTQSAADQPRVTITDPHRWVLAAKTGTFAHYGIEPGMTLDIENIRKINF